MSKNWDRKSFQIDEKLAEGFLFLFNNKKGILVLHHLILIKLQNKMMKNYGLKMIKEKE
jgi:hypothetical protein